MAFIRPFRVYVYYMTIDYLCRLNRDFLMNNDLFSLFIFLDSVSDLDRLLLNIQSFAKINVCIVHRK